MSIKEISYLTLPLTMLMAKSNYNEKHGEKAHFEYLAPVDSEIAER